MTRRWMNETGYALDRPRTVADPVRELNEQAATGRFAYLLAHADDGVIWGKVKDGGLITNASPRLRPETLQQARLFGLEAEWFVWRTDASWQAREAKDGGKARGPAYDEEVLLWGTEAGEAQGEFTPLVEADRGIRHAPPLRPQGRRSLRLVVRHYVEFDGEGAAFVALSRLVDLRNGGGR